MTEAAENLRRPEGATMLTRADNIVPLARLQRAAGAARIAFKRRGSRTVLADIHQSGCCKVRFPAAEPGNAPEAVLINTSGGLTDGDRIETRGHWRAGTYALVTTQAAERIYRSRGQPARVDNRLIVEENATAFWLPQETILFDGGRLRRRLTAAIEEGGSLLACESTLFGRAAMGESVRGGSLRDIWRLRYGGRLVFADALALDGGIQAALARPALANGAAAMSTLIYAGEAAEALCGPLRDALAGSASPCGCSVNGPVLVARMLGQEGAGLRRDLIALLRCALDTLALRDDAADDGARAVLPRVWSC